MKIYTKRGDGGKTGLIGGDEISKSNARINAYGEVDELNSILGWCASISDKQIKKILERENRNLFVLGSWLATPDSASSDTKKSLPEWNSKSTEVLEGEIDGFSVSLSELKNFILPGGSELASRLHIARTVCRRAERAVCRLSEKENVNAIFIQYLNRLSDRLFTLARVSNRNSNIEDTIWNPD